MRQAPVQEEAVITRERSPLINAMFLPGWRSQWSSTVQVKKLPNGQDELINWFRTQTSGKPVDIILGSPLVLTKYHVLPSKGRKQAQKILELRAEALQSASNKQLVAVSHLHERGRTEDKHVQYLVRVDDIDRIKAALGVLDTPVRSISHDQDGKRALFVDKSASLDIAINRWWVAFLVTIIGICGLSLVTQARALQASDTLLAALRSQLADVQTDLNQVIGSSEAGKAENLRLNRVIQMLGNGQSTTPILANVTSLLSDQVWLSELVFQDNGELRISGQTSDEVIAMIATIEAVDWVRQVTLTRPVRTDSLTQQSSFDLLIQLDLERL